MLTKDQIFALQDREIQELHIPEWKDSIYVRVVSGKDRLSFESAVLSFASGTDEERAAALAKVVRMVACDKEGNPLFDEGDAEEILKKNSKPLFRITQAAIKLNKMSERDLEDAEKNLESSQN